MTNHYEKFEYKRMNTVEVTYFTNKASPKHLGRKKMSKFNTQTKIEKYLLNVHKMVGAHLQCVYNHYAKFEYKVINTVGVTDYTK